MTARTATGPVAAADPPLLARAAALVRAVEPARRAAADHPLFRALVDARSLAVFMEHHVWAVWDFMTLVKALQRALTCVEPWWRPVGDVTSRRLINEIVLGEESDEDGRGGHRSHFELYLDAMREVGADVAPIEAMTAQLAARSPEGAMRSVGGPGAAKEFARRTVATVRTGALPAIAAEFAVGREHVIPAMFGELVEGLRPHHPSGLERLRFYLARHIEVDGDEHGPMARRLLAVACGRDDAAWRLAEVTARDSLQARARLWDACALALGRRSDAAAGV